MSGGGSKKKNETSSYNCTCAVLDQMTRLNALLSDCETYLNEHSLWGSIKTITVNAICVNAEKVVIRLQGLSTEKGIVNSTSDANATYWTKYCGGEIGEIEKITTREEIHKHDISTQTP